METNTKRKRYKQILTSEFNNNYVYYSPKDLWSNTDETMFNVPSKIISRQTSDKIIATIDTEQFFSLDSTHVINFTNKINIEFLLGVYNSKLIIIYQSRSTRRRQSIRSG